jgi:hypothetical protein
VPAPQLADRLPHLYVVGLYAVGGQRLAQAERLARVQGVVNEGESGDAFSEVDVRRRPLSGEASKRDAPRLASDSVTGVIDLLEQLPPSCRQDAYAHYSPNADNLPTRRSTTRVIRLGYTLETAAPAGA